MALQSIWNGEAWLNIRWKLNSMFSELYSSIATFITASSTNTFTNKTISLWSNTVSWTKAQFDTSCTDDNFAFLGQANTFTTTQTFADVTIWWTTNTLTVNWQNRTSWWTSFTPTVFWDSWSWHTYSYQSGKYKLIGKTCHFSISLKISWKWTTSWWFNVTTPLTALSTSGEHTINWWIIPQWSITIKGIPAIWTTSIYFLAWIDTGIITWSNISVNDVIRISWSYEIS